MTLTAPVAVWQPQTGFDAFNLFVLRYDLEARRAWHMEEDGRWHEHPEGVFIEPALTVSGRLAYALRQAGAIETPKDLLDGLLGALARISGEITTLTLAVDE